MSSKISDLAIEVRDAYVPDKEDKLPYIGLEHAGQGTLHISSIGSSQEVKSHKFRFKSGDILFGTLRPYFRKVIVAPCDGVCSTEFCVVRPKEPEDKYFVFYGMAHQQFIKYATTNSKGARPRTKWKLFSDFEFPDFLPSQRRDIGKILSAYDDLIENNRRRIQLLEQAARLLYREWFVHLRFPGHEHVTITDGMPDGWKQSTVSGLGKIVTGKTPSTKTPENFGGNIPFVKTPDMHRSRVIVGTEELSPASGRDLGLFQ
jgi:type I restriction enzyme S subunit